MTPLFKKLNYKGQKEICIVNFPVEFVCEMEAMEKVTTINTDIDDTTKLEFVLAFVKTKDEIDHLAPVINSKLQGDGVVWFAYPKGTSKKYKVDINRDNGWESLGDLGLEAVRAVAIDEDWSALRFRKVEHIKTMKRREGFALSKEGKAKIKRE